MDRKLNLELNKNQILNIIESLTYYKDIIKPQYKSIIDAQMNEINRQLQLQGVSILQHYNEPILKIGDIVNIENMKAVIIGESDKDEFVKVAISPKFIIDDVPIVLLEK